MNTECNLSNASNDDAKSGEGNKYRENPDDKEQDEVISVLRRNPRRLRRYEQRSLKHIKNYIERSKDKLFFIKSCL